MNAIFSHAYLDSLQGPLAMQQRHRRSPLRQKVEHLPVVAQKKTNNPSLSIL